MRLLLTIVTIILATSCSNNNNPTPSQTCGGVVCSTETPDCFDDKCVKFKSLDSSKRYIFLSQEETSPGIFLSTWLAWCISPDIS